MILEAFGRVFIIVAAIAAFGFFVTMRSRRYLAAAWVGAFGVACLTLGLASGWLATKIEPYFTYLFPPTVLVYAAGAFVHIWRRRRRAEAMMRDELAKPEEAAPIPPQRTEVDRIQLDFAQTALPQVFFANPRSAAEIVLTDPKAIARLVAQVAARASLPARSSPITASWKERIGADEALFVAFDAHVNGEPALMALLHAGAASDREPRVFVGYLRAKGQVSVVEVVKGTLERKACAELDGVDPALFRNAVMALLT